MSLPLPLPASAIRALPGVRHTLETAEEFEALASLKPGEQFTWRGSHNIATGEPCVTEHGDGWRRLFLKACRTNPAMRSGWELADIALAVPVELS